MTEAASHGSCIAGSSDGPSDSLVPAGGIKLKYFKEIFSRIKFRFRASQVQVKGYELKINLFLTT